MNRHQLAALARGTVSVIAGGAILYALGSWLGWWSVVGLAVAAAVGMLADMVRWPGERRAR